jgi:hypothetical protein
VQGSGINTKSIEQIMVREAYHGNNACDLATTIPEALHLGVSTRWRHQDQHVGLHAFNREAQRRSTCDEVACQHQHVVEISMGTCAVHLHPAHAVVTLQKNSIENIVIRDNGVVNVAWYLQQGGPCWYCR